MPNVSIILPTYNRAPTLSRAIDSVLKQTYKDFELIIIDDGSVDKTKDIVANYLSDPRIKYLHQENAGASAARNRGIQVSTGDLIAFQDSDDEWMPDKLHTQVQVFEKNDDSLSLVYGDMLRVEPDGKISTSYAPDVNNGDLFNADTLEYKVFGIGIQSCLIRKKYLIEVGGFDTKFPRFIDLELFIRLSKISHIYRLEQILVKYYATEGISTNPKNAAIARELLIEKYNLEAKMNPASLANQYLQIAGCYWKVKEKVLTRKYCRFVFETNEAKFKTRFQAIFLLLIPRSLGRIILGR